MEEPNEIAIPVVDDVRGFLQILHIIITILNLFIYTCIDIC